MNKLTLTLLIVGLCASACLARTAPQIRRPFKFSPGQTYIYEYRGRQWNGASIADQYAGLTLDCDVILQGLPESSGSEVWMKLDDIKIEQLHTQTLNNDDIRQLNQGEETNVRQSTMYKEELSKPIRFTYLDGKIVRFVAESSDAEWSINIKKSILSMFQLDLAPTKIIKSSSKLVQEQLAGYQSEDIVRATNEMPLVYPIYEESFGGICETNYQIDSIDNLEHQQQQDIPVQQFSDVLNVTKTVNYKNCLTDPSVSYDRHSFGVSTQTIKGKLFSKQPSVFGQNYYTVPEELKQKYSNVYTSKDAKDNVAQVVPVERYSYTKYNISTSGPFVKLASAAPTSEINIIEGIYSEGKIKYEADGDVLISDTQQSLKLISCVPTRELARLAPEISSQLVAVQVRQPVQYETIQCELSTQKLKFYQAIWTFAQAQQQLKQQQPRSALYSHQMALPFALSASWYPIVASGQSTAEQSFAQTLNPEQLAKSYENLLWSLTEDVLAEDVADSKKAAEKVVRMVNIIAFLPKYKLAEIHEHIVEKIQQAKQQQVRATASTTGKLATIDNQETNKWKVARKLYLDTLPLAGSKQAIEMIEYLIESQRVQAFEAKELCEAVPANLRYPDTEIIDAFIRISQLPQVRKSRALFASCSIAVGKMIGQAYAKSQDASFKPTTYESADRLPAQLRQDDLVKQVVEEADPRRQLPANWNSPDQEQLYEQLVLDEQDLIKYVKLYKQLLNKASQYHEKVIMIETLAHMRVPQVLPILEPFVSGRLSLGQCLSSQPLDISRPIEQSQWYNYQGRAAFASATRRQLQQVDADQKDWSEESSYAAEECNYMRTIAIYALAHLARSSPAKVQALLMPVFDNTFEPYQIRIAAFTTIMMAPIEVHTLERIASQMWREPNKEVASFVVGTIDTFSKLNSPSLSSYKYAAMKASESMPKQYLDTWKFSSIAGGDHFNMQKQTGSAWVAEIVKSNVSSIPRGAYFNYGKQHGPTGQQWDNVVELGFTSKGLESLLKEYVAYNRQQAAEGNTDDYNIVASIFENLYDAKDDIVKYYKEARDAIKQASKIQQGDRRTKSELSFAESQDLFSQTFFKRQQPIDGVNSQLGKQERKTSDLFEATRAKRSITFNARNSADDDEEAKLTVFAKLFESTSYHAMDKKQILNLIEKLDDYIKAAADELIMGGKLHYVKLMMPANMWHMVPSQLGLPVVVTHRKPIIASIKVDGAPNGQLTSSKLSQLYRQQVTGDVQPNILGHNFATPSSLNITAQVHPKIMHSSIRFMFAVEQAQNQAYGVQTEKSHQLSMPLELSIAYSAPKQLVSIAIEPKTENRIYWTKEAGKTFIGPVALSTSQADSWLGKEHLIRVPSKESQFKRQERSEMMQPSLLSSIQGLLNKPKESQLAAIEELETPYKFEQTFEQPSLGLKFNVEGVTDDEEIVRSMAKPTLAKDQRQQWTSTDDYDEIDQHMKSGPFSEYLHLAESIKNRPAKYVEAFTTVQKKDQKAPVYRFDFVLSAKQQQPMQNKPMSRIAQEIQGQRPISRLGAGQSPEMWAAIEQAKKINKQQQMMMQEVY